MLDKEINCLLISIDHGLKGDIFAMPSGVPSLPEFPHNNHMYDFTDQLDLRNSLYVPPSVNHPLQLGFL